MQGEERRTVDESRAVGAFDQAELNAYMEAVHANGDAPNEAERIAYYQQRYDEVKAAYKKLILQKEESEGRKDEQLVDALVPSFRKNFAARRFVVSQLRMLGQKVDDPYVPMSLTGKA